MPSLQDAAVSGHQGWRQADVGECFLLFSASCVCGCAVSIVLRRRMVEGHQRSQQGAEESGEINVRSVILVPRIQNTKQALFVERK